MQNRIVTVNDLVNAFGGGVLLSQALGIRPTGITKMKNRQAIPHSHRLKLIVMLKKRGFVFAPELFGLTETDMAILERPIRVVREDINQPALFAPAE